MTRNSPNGKRLFHSAYLESPNIESAEGTYFLLIEQRVTAAQ